MELVRIDHPYAGRDPKETNIELKCAVYFIDVVDVQNQLKSTSKTCISG